MSFPFPEDFVTQAPVISTKRLLQILEAVYGIKSAKCTKLTGYDDLNFLLEDVRYKDDVSAGRKLICKFSNPIEASLPDLMSLIHSDINETNVLLIRDKDNKLKVSALLDFGDAHVSLRLFEYSSAILYIILGMGSEDQVEDWKRVIRTFFRAFIKERKSGEFMNDIKHCQLAMRARLVASLIYGLRTVRINYRKEDPSYILKTQSNGWDVLRSLNDNDLDIPSLIQ
uniref:APH domain-containing protein n=1 Tax=Bursaphelenchus xylophilus TaxID=6326 RepID=A0A1I7SCK1_BURXY